MDRRFPPTVIGIAILVILTMCFLIYFLNKILKFILNSKGIKMSKTLNILSLAGFTVIVIFGFLLLWMNLGNLNFIKKNEVKQNALKYISETYPDYEVAKISVKHEWYDNVYIVTYSNNSGDKRGMSFKHTGKELNRDYYIENNSERIISHYKQSIQTKLENEINEKVAPIYYLVVTLVDNSGEKRRRMVLEGEKINRDPVDCSIGLSGTFTKVEFAEAILKSVEIINDSDFNISSLSFSAFNHHVFNWSDDMFTMSAEELAQCIKD